uniref:Tc1-like transposase DDE domain-containing protein n=1 Tax=Cyprinus carpio TaxID=7962 RepID=A0A8C1N644_CYPCA
MGKGKKSASAKRRPGDGRIQEKENKPTAGEGQLTIQSCLNLSKPLRNKHTEENAAARRSPEDTSEPSPICGASEQTTAVPHKGAGTSTQRINGEKSTDRKLKEKQSETNRKVTDYFPVRRSCRKSKAELKCEKQRHIDDLLRNNVEEGLKVSFLSRRSLSGKSVGRKKCGKKRCTTRRGDRTLRKIVEKDRFQTLGDLRKQWTESGVETSRATVHRRVLLNQKQRQKRLTWATEKQHWTVAQWSKVLFSDESKFCMSFGNQGARVWRKTGEKEMPKCLKSSVKYPQSVMVWGAMSAAGVGPLCFIKGRVNAASYQEILEHFMLPSAEKLYGDEDFVFQHDLAPAHSAKTTGKWFTDHGITVLNWPANSPDLNPIENLWDIVKRKLRDARPNTLDELKAAIEASWASITPQQCHRLIASMPRRIEAVISAKGFPTKY